MSTIKHLIRQFTVLMLAAMVAAIASAQAPEMNSRELREELLDSRWRHIQTQHFTIISTLSARRTETLAVSLESWRGVAAQVLGFSGALPPEGIPNYVYFFEQPEVLDGFILMDSVGYFTATPRANYMAFALDDDDALARGLHHYSHFLLRNFQDLRLPRWYEEAMAGYLSRVQMVRGEPELEQYEREFFYRMVQLSEELPMERLLYSDAALASPRLIQIANLKSEALLYYFLHGSEAGAFPDRRQDLQEYLAHMLAGRNPRFAFDQAFAVTTEEMDQEFRHYLLNSARPEVALAVDSGAAVAAVTAADIAIEEVALRLAELALNAGELDTAEEFFRYLLASDSPPARAWSGLGDSLRFQDTDTSDEEIARYFETARETAPGDLHILLDYGEYWESELAQCDREFGPERVQQLEAVVFESFESAYRLSPGHPEVNLALGEAYLFPGRDWQQGRAFQQRAFQMLPADTYVMEQAAKYAIAAGDYDEAQRLIEELAQPMHFYGEPPWVTQLRGRLESRMRGREFDACANE